MSRSEKRDIATGRKSEKEEVPQREGLRKGKVSYEEEQERNSTKDRKREKIGEVSQGGS